MDLIEKENLEEYGITASLDKHEILSSLRSKHGFKKESLLNMSENLVTFKKIIKVENGRSEEWIIADSYDLMENKDLQMKFNVAFMESGMQQESLGFYQKKLSDHDPDTEYHDIVMHIDNSVRQMLDPSIKLITEKEFGRNDRSAIYVQTPIHNDFK